MTSEQELLDLLGKAVAKNMGGYGHSIGNKISEKTDSKTYNIRNSADRKFDANIKKLENFNDGLSYATNLLPKKISEALSESGDGVAKNLAKSISSLEDVFKVEDQIKAMHNIYARLKDINGATIESDEELNKILKEIGGYAKFAGLSMKDFGIRVSKGVDDANSEFSKITINKNSIKKLHKSIDSATEAFNNAEESVEKYVRNTEKMTALYKTTFNSFINIFRGSITLAEKELRKAKKFGLADAGIYEGIKNLGITQLEYMEILKDTRVAQMAAKTAGVDFTERLVDASAEFRPFTENLVEAANAAKRSINNMSNIGVSSDLLGDAVTGQADIYTKYFRSLGIGEEEFSNYTKELINNSSTQKELYLLREKERASFIKGLQVRAAENTMIGYSAERISKMNEMISGLLGMDPKERMKKAAKERAMLGALGLGDEGQKLFELQIRYRTMSAEQRVQANKEITDLRAKAASKFSQVSSGPDVSLGQSMMFQNLAEKTGTAGVFETFEAETSKGRVINAKIYNEIHEIHGLLKKGLEIKDIASGVGGSAIGAAGIGAAGYVLKKFGGGMFGKLANSGISKSIGGMFSGKGASAVSKNSMAGLFDSSIGGASKGAGKGMLGKLGTKSLSKLIPGIGLALGGAYAVNRIGSGDPMGAAMELFSGVASLVPGIGTAISAATDAAIIARDLNNSVEDKTNDTNSSKTNKDSTDSDTDNSESSDGIMNRDLLDTMKEIRDLLNFLKDNDDEKAQALSNVANATIDTMRYNMVNSSVGNRSIS